MSAIRTIVERLLPVPVLQAILNFRRRNALPEYKHLSTQQVFTKIYLEGGWGRAEESGQTFFSGTGSRDSAIVGPYIDALRQWLAGFETPPDVVDLGCGDFFIGSSVRALCGRYTACDIVAPLIEFNREKYQDLGVDFRVLDLTRDELPPGDVVCIRQVLQHLSNREIAAAVPRLAARYKFLVLTEHLPARPSFVENLDKPAGPDTRLEVASGIVLTSRPFKLKVRAERTLCEVHEYGGVIRTTLYELA